jgi:hypothetical protein
LTCEGGGTQRITAALPPKGGSIDKLKKGCCGGNDSINLVVSSLKHQISSGWEGVYSNSLSFKFSLVHWKDLMGGIRGGERIGARFSIIVTGRHGNMRRIKEEGPPNCALRPIMFASTNYARPSSPRTAHLAHTSHLTPLDPQHACLAAFTPSCLPRAVFTPSTPTPARP